MGNLTKKIGKLAKSPKASQFEKEMMRKAKDPKTKKKISKGFRRLKAKKT